MRKQRFNHRFTLFQSRVTRLCLHEQDIAAERTNNTGREGRDIKIFISSCLNACKEYSCSAHVLVEPALDHLADWSICWDGGCQRSRFVRERTAREPTFQQPTTTQEKATYS